MLLHPAHAACRLLSLSHCLGNPSPPTASYSAAAFALQCDKSLFSDFAPLKLLISVVNIIIPSLNHQTDTLGGTTLHAVD